MNFPCKLTPEAKPQTTKSGKVRKDRYGNPATSIRVEVSQADKMQIIKRMSGLRDLWLNKEWKPLFPTEGHYGVDPKKMTTEKVFSDLQDQIPYWYPKSSYIYKSFITRHVEILNHIKSCVPEDISNMLDIQFGIELTQKKKTTTQASFGNIFS